MPSLQTGQLGPGQTLLSVASENDVQPGSAGKSVLPSPLLSRPSMHCATRHVRIPTGPSQAKPSEQRSAPVATSGLSQLAPGLITPSMLIENVVPAVAERASTASVYVPPCVKPRVISEARPRPLPSSLHASAGSRQSVPIIDNTVSNAE